MPPQIPIFDGHNDILHKLHLPKEGEERSFFERSEHGHLDLPRARDGGFAGGFFAVYAPSEQEFSEDDVIETDSGREVPLSPPLDLTYAQQMVIGMAARLFRLEDEAAGALRVVRTADELDTCLDDGTIAAVFHVEGADAIDTDLNMLRLLYEAGLRSLGIVWSRPNAFAEGVPFKYPGSPDTGPGLTDAGRRLVRACNQLGIMLDLSHLNEKGFWDVADLSDAPLVATHSNAHALCPATRNLTDKQLDVIGESGGIVGINFSVPFLRKDMKRDADTPVTTIVRHIDYVAERIGIDHVAIGSDFDGALIPNEIGDVSGLPKLIAALRDAGYDDVALHKITHKNWQRILRATWCP